MECRKITSLSGNIPDKVPWFITKKWIEVYEQSGGTYNIKKQIRFKTSMLRSDLCDYSDAYIVVEGIVTVEGNNKMDGENRFSAFKNNAPFTVCISEINNILIGNAEYLDILMPMYNLLQYSKNYRKTTGSLWNYYRDEPNDPITNSASFKNKNSITGKTIVYNVPERITDEDSNPVNNPNYDANKIDTKETKIVVPLKYLSNFWKTLDMAMIDCEVSLTLTWSKDCVLADLITRNGSPNADPPVAAINALTNATFKITDCKLYVPVVTLSAENGNKLLEQVKTEIKRKITWNKYRSEMSKQTKSNNLNYLIYPTNVNRLFVLPFKNKDEDVRNSFKI